MLRACLLAAISTLISCAPSAPTDEGLQPAPFHNIGPQELDECIAIATSPDRSELSHLPLSKWAEWVERCTSMTASSRGARVVRLSQCAYATAYDNTAAPFCSWEEAANLLRFCAIVDERGDSEKVSIAYFDCLFALTSYVDEDGRYQELVPPSEWGELVTSCAEQDSLARDLPMDSFAAVVKQAIGTVSTASVDPVRAQSFRRFRRLVLHKAEAIYLAMIQDDDEPTKGTKTEGQTEQTYSSCLDILPEAYPDHRAKHPVDDINEYFGMCLNSQGVERVTATRLPSATYPERVEQAIADLLFDLSGTISASSFVSEVAGNAMSMGMDSSPPAYRECVDELSQNPEQLRFEEWSQAVWGCVGVPSAPLVYDTSMLQRREVRIGYCTKSPTEEDLPAMSAGKYVRIVRWCALEDVDVDAYPNALAAISCLHATPDWPAASSADRNRTYFDSCFEQLGAYDAPYARDQSLAYGKAIDVVLSRDDPPSSAYEFVQAVRAALVSVLYAEIED